MSSNSAKIHSIESKSARPTRLEALSVNVMTCCPKTFNITFANESSRNTLDSIAHLLPAGVTGDTIVGQNIDVFHKTPEHQRRLMSDPSNFPHSAIIRLGPELLELYVDTVMDKGGKRIKEIVLSWSVVTEREQLKIMVDNMPINVIMCDAEECKINFINQTSIKTLKQIEHLLPAKADALMGECIDIFHKNPTRIRDILRDPNNLPHKAKIQLGDEILKLDVSAVIDRTGYYIGPMVCWSVITEQETLSRKVMETSSIVSELSGMAQTLAAAADQSSSQSGAAASASEEAAANMSTVAAASEEMSSSIHEISSQISRSSQMTEHAVRLTQKTNETVSELNESSAKIEEVLTLIQNIAAQTNLLALNATIEAARAGEAGKGFAVVASEVKHLASQTAQATEEIAGQITGMQNATHGAVSAIQDIGKNVEEINESVTAIAAAVEEQNAATSEISRNVQEASTATREVSSNTIGVQEAATETGNASKQLLQSANTLSDAFDKLKQIL